MVTATSTSRHISGQAGEITSTVTVPSGFAESIRKKVITRTRTHLRKLAVEVTDHIVTNWMSLFDHHISEGALKKAGYPYSAKRPNLGFHSPSFSVHEQSGNLIKYYGGAGEMEPFTMGSKTTASSLTVWISLDKNWNPISTKSGDLPLAGILHHGTSKMVARPFLTVGTVEYLREKAMLR